MQKEYDPLLVESYDYTLPKELIASSPANPKDSAKLLIYNRSNGSIEHTIFREFLSYIPKDISIILNDTKVIKARVFGKKESGAEIELFLNRPLVDDKFSVYIKGRVKVGTLLLFDNRVTAKVVELNIDGTRVVEFYQDRDRLDFTKLNKILEKIGHTPLPPYIKRDDQKSDISDYQTLFAKNIGAVAAPTASLHFTDKLFFEMKNRFKTTFITLHVGAGTFKPVVSKDIKNHIMHKEFYTISKESREVIDSKTDILAIGTTVTRTIEHYFRENIVSGESNLFLHPLNPPKRVNYLLTNFHLPKSTLLMLVSSFIGIKETLRVYEEAIKNRYRFYSYGDAMLII